MKTRVRALALAAAVSLTPVVGVLTAEPAAAANCSYPATSSPYSMRISPAQYGNPTIIKKGGSVTISVRLIKGSLLCGGKNIYLYTHGPTDFRNGVSIYRITRTGTTNSNGLVSWTFLNRQSDFRYYAVLEGTGGSVRSQGGLVQVR